MIDMITGWIAYQLSAHTSASLLFLLVLVGGGLLLWRFQSKPDTFDLRDIICSWDGEKQIISTTKTLLAGAFGTSTYYMIEHPSETVFATYLAAWVLNGGVTAWQKTQTPKDK